MRRLVWIVKYWKIETKILISVCPRFCFHRRAALLIAVFGTEGRPNKRNGKIDNRYLIWEDKVGKWWLVVCCCSFKGWAPFSAENPRSFWGLFSPHPVLRRFDQPLSVLRHSWQANEGNTSLNSLFSSPESPLNGLELPPFIGVPISVMPVPRKTFPRPIAQP